jgi:hypothetical protein
MPVDSGSVRPYRSANMKWAAYAIVSLGCGFACVSANADCPDGQLQFSFSNLPVREAFALFADFAGLKPEIDLSLTQSEPMSFGCTPWRSRYEACRSPPPVAENRERDHVCVQEVELNTRPGEAP